jgi:hypothetical protein
MRVKHATRKSGSRAMKNLFCNGLHKKDRGEPPHLPRSNAVHARRTQFAPQFGDNWPRAAGMARLIEAHGYGFVM